MEKKHICKCGKEFPSFHSMIGHKKGCPLKFINQVEAQLQKAKKAGPSQTAKSSSILRNLKAKRIQKNVVNKISTNDLNGSNISISFRCVRCHMYFPTVDSYRQHYQVDHLGVDPSSTIESSAQIQNCGKNDQSKNDQLEKDEEPVVQVPRSFCKRCRARILSSSDEEEESMEAPLKKIQKNEAGCARHSPVIIKDKVSKEIKSPSSSNLGQIKKQEGNDDIASVSAIRKNKSILRDHLESSGASTSSQRSDESGTESPVVLSRNATTSNPQCFEIVKELLKDANSVSKPLKVLILNFVNGQRVKPYPTKDSVFTIRLGEKTDTIKAADGSEKPVLRESYVKLNYETGEWEKIEKIKQLHSFGDQSTKPVSTS